ncbi:MAG: 16S rRNA (guanine(527)-N(7))-methyltransferase RsmG [Flavobacteriales bacterium]|jgi:16S rRNA (guanine527-N7)-methyltransferase|nr:16S rRNA (guanine(527)-N(7))-methyltransferase RsmG [Flavobacteriales bacterium]MBT6014127.1 16S rRNA (guanine(527)-N(7))-methyltransferase RsmG [Flavobacteriales bacterium]MBT7481518.1 16S rRNA (guanine(527)-N(7))-methyltransferase RsmG [Flavobacteriales bacterium]
MDLILKYFPDLTETQIKKFSQLQNLYNEWNAQINVISRKDMENLYVKHILHSLAIAKVIQFSDGSKVLDVGTGGGFPGIPLAILFPKVEFLLVDSIGKKIKVVNEVSSAIELKNLTAQHKRAEQVVGQFDFVVSRAVTKMKVFQQWVRKRISTQQKNTLFNGILYLKGGDLTEELQGIKNVDLYEIPDFFEEVFFETKKVVYIGY